LYHQQGFSISVRSATMAANWGWEPLRTFDSPGMARKSFSIWP
jgi:hypothetical protein